MKRRLPVTTITASELTAWRACPHRWGLRYVDGLVPRVGARPLRVGTAIHAGLAAAYRLARGTPDTAAERRVAAKVAAREAILAAHQEAIASLQVEELLDESDEVARLATWVSEHFVDRFAEDWEHLDPIGIELPFELQLRDVLGRRVPGLQFAGVMDLLAFDRRVGDVIVMDHKTTSGSIDGLDRKIELDPQMAGYVWAARELAAMGALQRAEGWVVTPDAVSGRVAFNVIRKAIPRAPKLNKDGRVSTAAIDTLPEVYADALDEQERRGIPVTEEQRSLLDRLRNKGESYIARREFWLSTSDVERWRTELFVEASRIRQAERDPACRTRNPLACSVASAPVCAYRQICLDPDAAEFREGFERRPRREEVERAKAEVSDGS